MLLVVDPASVRDLSLQLSFTPLLALVLLAPPPPRAGAALLPDPRRPPRLGRALEPLREALRGVSAASVAVTLASIPLVATAFHRISLVGWATNVLALPVASVLTLACAVTAGAFCVSPALAAAPLLVASLAARALLTLVQTGAAVPLGTISSPGFPWPATVLFALGLLGVALGVKRSGWLVAVALGAVLGRPLLETRPPLELTALPVGHGDALLVSSRGAHLLVDGGGVPDGIDPGARVVLPYLRERGIRRLDAVALSHPHPDHALGLLTVLREIPADRLWLPAGVERGPLVEALLAAAGRARVEWLSAGDRRTLGGATVHVLSPPRDRKRSTDGERPQPRPPPRDLRPVGAASGRCRRGGGGQAAASRQHRGEGAAPWVPDLELATADLLQPGVAGGLLGRTRQSLRPARTGGGGSLEGERSRGPPHRRGWSDPREPRRRRRPLGNVPGTGRPARCPTACRRGGHQCTVGAMIPEDLDLAALSRELHLALGPGEPVGYLRGKAKMRDALVDLRGFSQLEAESVVDTLELQGYLHFLGDPRAPSEAESRWDFRTG